jgi:acyl-CoA synthetase (NDP forming)/GNAT superfamily N-acetyltransferase
VLRDGSTVNVRATTTEDVARLRAFLASLSDESRWFRFFSAGVNLDAAARSAASPDGLSLLALRDGAVAGHGTYIRAAPGRAEVAFAVADAWHGHGIATVLLAHLAHAASAEAIETFTATVLSANHRMLGVFHDSGFPVSARRSEGAIEIEFPTSLSPAARHRFEERQSDADVAAVGHVLRPSSVAVIGASEDPGTVGGAVVRNLLAAGFPGSLHLVGADGGEPAGHPAVAAIADVEGDVELAVIAVPADDVIDAARACAAKGVRALVVLTAGFADAGPAGRARQGELLAVCRAAGMRMVGPDSLGVANPDPAVGLNATFAPSAPAAGSVGFATQSGAFGIAAIDAAAARGIGLSSFVSMGDKADLSGNDFMEYWERDAGTSALLLYLESFGNPRRFGRIARRITRAKPIVAVKGGRKAAGGRTLSSSTGALLAAADVTVDALFTHAGVLRAGTVEEMFDVAGLLARQPLPRGDRVAVLTNARGPGLLCEDACEAAGLRAGALVDLGAAAAADDYGRALRTLLDGDAADAVVTIFVPPLAARADEVARAIAAAAAGAGRPVLGVWPAAELPTAADTGDVPRFPTPEEAVRALAHAVRHARRREAPPDPPFEPDADTATAATIVAGGLEREGGWLAPTEVERLLGCWGIPMAERDTGRAGPVDGGTELLVGAVGDPAFGPLVVCGAGGAAVELLGDVQVRLAPLGAREADAMLRELRTFPLLDGYRGRPRADLESLRDLVLRVAALAATHPAVAELDLDPVVATSEGALVAGARVRVEAPGPAAPFPSLNV